MTTVYIIFDDCPQEFGDKAIIKVYSKEKTAKEIIKFLKEIDPYETQYLTLLKFIVDEK